MAEIDEDCLITHISISDYRHLRCIVIIIEETIKKYPNAGSPFIVIRGDDGKIVSDALCPKSTWEDNDRLANFILDDIEENR